MNLEITVALTAAVTVRRSHTAAPYESRTPMRERSTSDVEFRPDISK